MKREDFLKMKNGLYFKSVRYFVKFKDDEKFYRDTNYELKDYSKGDMLI